MPIEKTLVDKKTGKAMPTLKWRFTGSAMKQPDPNKPDKVYGADSTLTLIAHLPVTDEIGDPVEPDDEGLSRSKMETNKASCRRRGRP